MRAYRPLDYLRNDAANAGTPTALYSAITRIGVHHGWEVAAGVLGEFWPVVSGKPTADRLLQWLIARAPDAASVATTLMNVAERGAFMQAAQETSLTVYRHFSLRKDTGWFRSPRGRPSFLDVSPTADRARKAARHSGRSFRRPNRAPASGVNPPAGPRSISEIRMHHSREL